MLLEALSVAVVGYIAYSVYGGGSKTVGSVTEALNERIDNGYQLRDITYTDTIDVAHPDVKNNQVVLSGLVAKDRGMNGLERGYSQLYHGSSELFQPYRTDNLYL